MLPPIDHETGRLPGGEHPAEWQELMERFGWNPRRRQLLAKEEPADFDACWDTEGVDLDTLDPVLLDLSRGRAAQKARFGGELFPNVTEVQSGLVFLEFFQNERDTGRKGIVVLSIGGSG